MVEVTKVTFGKKKAKVTKVTFSKKKANPECPDCGGTGAVSGLICLCTIDFGATKEEVVDKEIKIRVHDGSMEETSLQLVNTWCDCGWDGIPIYRDDNICSCGCRKHHYHCRECGGITQVG